MDEDALRTPHGSIMTSQQSSAQSHTSPGSSITLTPASSKDMSAVAEQVTPSSIPLPPVTPGEEAALKTPITSPDSQAVLFPKMPTLPSSSPTTKQPNEATSPISSVKTSSDIGADDSYEGGARRTARRSTGSSSSTSLEVSEIMEGVRPANHPEETEELDEEFEDAKGDVEDEEEEEGHVELHQRGDAPKEPENSGELEGMYQKKRNFIVFSNLYSQLEQFEACDWLLSHEYPKLCVTYPQVDTLRMKTSSTRVEVNLMTSSPSPFARWIRHR